MGRTEIPRFALATRGVPVAVLKPYGSNPSKPARATLAGGLPISPFRLTRTTRAAANSRHHGRG